MSKTRDFDSYFSEVKQEPVSFTFHGKQYVLAASLPVAVALKLYELQKRGQSKTTEDEGIELMRLVFGDDNFNELLRSGIGIDELKQIFEWVIEQYNPASTATKATSPNA